MANEAEVNAAARELLLAQVADLKHHAEKHLREAIEPIRDDVRELKRTTGGSGDRELGLVRKIDGIIADNRVFQEKLKMLEHTLENKLNSLDLISDLHARFVRDITSTGKTPPGGTPEVVVGSPQSRRSKRPLIDSDTLKLILLVLGAVVGVGGGNFAYQSATGPSEKAVQETAEIVADKRSDLERREKAVARREQWVAHQIARSRTTQPTLPEPAVVEDATGGPAVEPAAESE
jgi:hypothetical protein